MKENSNISLIMEVILVSFGLLEATNNLCHETCRIMFFKMTGKSKFLLSRPKIALLVKILFIVFYLARLIFTGQTSNSDVVYP